MTDLIRHGLIIATCASLLLLSAFGSLYVYGGPLGVHTMELGARMAAFGGVTIHRDAPVCDRATIYAEVADVVAEAVARPVVVVARRK